MALGWFGLDEYWKQLALTGIGSSTLLLLLFWHPWLMLGFVINAFLIYSIQALGWPFGA